MLWFRQTEPTGSLRITTTTLNNNRTFTNSIILPYNIAFLTLQTSIIQDVVFTFIYIPAMDEQSPLNHQRSTAESAASSQPGPITFGSLPPELRTEIWRHAIESESRSSASRVLYFVEHRVLFLVDDMVNPDVGNDPREAVKFLLRLSGPQDTAHGIQNLSRVSYEARHKVLRRLDMVRVGDRPVRFDPDKDTICICPQSRKVEPVFPAAATNSQEVVLGTVHPLPKSIRLLALNCSFIPGDRPRSDLCSVMILLILASEAVSLRLLNYDVTFRQAVISFELSRSRNDDHTLRAWAWRLRVSKEFLQRRWYRLSETRIIIGLDVDSAA